MLNEQFKKGTQIVPGDYILLLREEGEGSLYHVTAIESRGEVREAVTRCGTRWHLVPEELYATVQW